MTFTLRQPLALMIVWQDGFWLGLPLIGFGGVHSRPRPYLVDVGGIGFRARYWRCLGFCLNVNWGERDVVVSLTIGFFIGSFTLDLGDLTLIPEYST